VANDFTGMGGIRTDLIYDFMPQGNYNMAVYRLTGDTLVQQRIVHGVHQLIAAGVPFDPLFDIADSTQMYCAEMVAHAVNQSFGQQVIVPTGTFMNRPVYTIEDCYRVTGAQCVYKK